MSFRNNSLYRFAGFTFDASRGKLWRDDKLQLLSPKASELLELLLTNSGSYVSKEEIFEKIWTDTFVEDGVLTQNIYTLRKILGRTLDGEQLIENKTRLGYRISNPVEIVASETVIESDSVTADGTEVATEKPPPTSKKWRHIGVLAAASVLLIATFGYVSYRIFGANLNSYFRKPIDYVKFTRLSNTGDLTEAAMSPDGKFLAFLRKDKVYLRDVVSEKEIPIEIPNVPAIGSLQFSPDGNFLYFCDTNTFLNASKILRVPRFGGDSVLIAERNFRRFSVSPDGKLLAFYTFDQSDTRVQLAIKDLETRAITAFDIANADGYRMESTPAWSPDGSKLIHITEKLSNQTNQLFVMNVIDGKMQEMKLPGLRRFRNASWFPDSKSFAISASKDEAFHLWKVYYPDGEAQPITSGIDSFENPIVSKDGKAILSVQRTENSNLFVASDTSLSDFRPITSGSTNNFGKSSLTWADEQNILFSSRVSQESLENLWLIDADGKAKRQITNEKEFRPNRPVSDGRSIYFNINRNKVANISRIDSGGGNREDVTDFSEGARGSPQISPDGRWLYYIFRSPNEVKIMRWDLAAKKEEDLIVSPDIQCGFLLVLSPDGRYLACPNWRFVPQDGGKNTEILLMSVESQTVVKSIYIARTASWIRFSPDGQAIDFVSDSNVAPAILRANFDDSPPKPVVQMPNGLIFNFSWSKDGKRLAIAQGTRSSDAVLLSDYEK